MAGSCRARTRTGDRNGGAAAATSMDECRRRRPGYTGAVPDPRHWFLRRTFADCRRGNHGDAGVWLSGFERCETANHPTIDRGHDRDLGDSVQRRRSHAVTSKGRCRSGHYVCPLRTVCGPGRRSGGSRGRTRGSRRLAWCSTRPRRRTTGTTTTPDPDCGTTSSCCRCCHQPRPRHRTPGITDDN